MFHDNPELKKKLQRLGELAKIIRIGSSIPLTYEEKAKEQELMDRMEFKLNSLVLESKIKEVDIKIEIYEQIAKLIKR